MKENITSILNRKQEFMWKEVVTSYYPSTNNLQKKSKSDKFQNGEKKKRCQGQVIFAFSPHATISPVSPFFSFFVVEAFSSASSTQGKLSSVQQSH